MTKGRKSLWVASTAVILVALPIWFGKQLQEEIELQQLLGRTPLPPYNLCRRGIISVTRTPGAGMMKGIGNVEIL